LDFFDVNLLARRPVSNDLVSSIYHLGSKLEPDLPGLFTCYREALKDNPEDARLWTSPLSLHKQIAWTVSRAEMRNILSFLRPRLEDVYARRLLEDVVEYAEQVFPPIYGEWREPTEIVLNVGEFLDDEVEHE
jgi:hypothetical protein